MLFNSIEYFLFLPVVFALYWFVFNRSLGTQNFLLLVASYFFYGWWSWRFLLLLILSTFLDYFYGFKVASGNKKTAKLFLWLSVINNLGILAVFKYYDFFATEFAKAFGSIGIHVTPMLLQVAIPVGISFYTFHGMSYVFDIYRKIRKPVKNFAEYAVFVCFFPLLVAGPIERANHLLPQVQAKRQFSHIQAAAGCRLILWGMIKKVVIADSLAVIVDEIFNNYHTHNSFTLILGAIAFSFQIYGDFSGYSDIAIGTAKLFGFELFSNFKFPYFSRDIAEFWRRWHISLSSWFRDYLYIPLGGSKNGRLVAVRNMFIIFIVSGFWHGASWNFIIWGGIHACGFLPLLFLNRHRRQTGKIVAFERKLPSFKEVVQIVCTFVFVTFAWIFFRIRSVSAAFGYIRGMFHNVNNIGETTAYLVIFIYIIPLLIADWYLRRDERALKVPNLPRFAKYFVYVFLSMLVLSFLAKNENQSFIYFQF